MDAREGMDGCQGERGRIDGWGAGKDGREIKGRDQEGNKGRDQEGNTGREKEGNKGREEERRIWQERRGEQMTGRKVERRKEGVEG